LGQKEYIRLQVVQVPTGSGGETEIYRLTFCNMVYTVWYTFYGRVTMETAKLFNNGRSQAVRLPKAFRFEGNEVYIKKVAEGVLLISKNQSVWDLWERNLMKYDTPFMMDRSQPSNQQERESLD
jgi:antitoxin VapB